MIISGPIANIRGPEGKRGERGLPGLEGVPTDQGIGELLRTWLDRDTDTGRALAEALETATSSIGTIPPLQPRGRILSRFQSGHAWTDAAGGWVQYTDLVAHGTRSWGFNSSTTPAENHVTRLEFPTPVDIRGKSVVLRCFISDPTKVTTFTVSFDSGASGNSNTTTYAPMSVRAVDGGKWWEFVFAYGQAFDQIGSPDREAMRRVGVRVVTNGAIQFRINDFQLVGATEALPPGISKPVIIESDDGDGTNVLMHEILSKYGARGTINMIAENMDRPDRLTFDQLKAWQRNDGWDVQAHAYYLTTQNFLNLTEEELDTELSLLRSWGRRHGFQCDYVIYPQGGFNDTVREVAARYFRGGRTVYQTPITLPGVRPYAMAAMSVQNTHTVENVTTYADQVVNSGGVAHLVFHHWVVGGRPAGDPIGWGTTELEALVQYGLANGWTFVTYSEVYGRS